MTDPGVPTGDNPRWTVDDGWLVLRDAHQSWRVEDIHYATNEDYDALVQAVRDAAEAPALQATADQWEEAHRKAQQIKDRAQGSFPADWSLVWELLDLLTEAPDGE